MSQHPATGQLTTPRCAARTLLLASLALLLATFPAKADHFRALPLDENAGHTHYRIVDQAGSTILIVRARAEYGSLDLRAREIVDRMDRAVDNQHEHGDLYFEIDWSHGQGIIHQVSRDGTVHFMVASVTPGDLEGARRREEVGDPFALARGWLDRIERAVESAQEVAPKEGHEAGVEHGEANAKEPGPSTRASTSGSATSEERDGGTPTTSGITLSVTPPDVAVYLDDSYQPRPTPDDALEASRGSLRAPVAPGRHTVEVVRPGYRSFRQEVQVKPGQIVELDVRLEPEDADPRQP